MKQPKHSNVGRPANRFAKTRLSRWVRRHERIELRRAVALAIEELEEACTNF